MSQISSGVFNRIDDYIMDINKNLNNLSSAVKSITVTLIKLLQIPNYIIASSEMESLVNTIKSQISNISRIKEGIHRANNTKSDKKGSFKLKDIVNRIKLLTDDEIRENFCKLVIDFKISSDFQIEGSATSLIQIILIHVINACHAYKKILVILN